MRHLKIILFAGLSVLFMAGFLWSDHSFQKELDLFVRAVRLVQSDYVDAVPVKRIFAGALDGMLKSLDPYSQYLDEDAYRDLRINTQGEFTGLGVEIGIRDGVLRVISPLEGSPAQEAGVEAGDTIIKINDQPTRGFSLAEAVKKMRGAPGTSVKLSVMREEEGKLLEFVIRRRTVLVKSISEARMVEPHIGYIRIASFQEKSAADFEKALEKLESENLRALILDVRNNSGGLLLGAVRIAEKFVPKGRVVVSTKGRNPVKNITFFSHSARPRVYPLAVLVNKGSASGSEILAGAIQDYKLGVVVGAKTFGKASVQTLTPLPGGTAIRMTTSRYYTPKGRLVHEAGITPDILVPYNEKKDPADKQLERAIEWIKNESSLSSPKSFIGDPDTPGFPLSRE